MHPKIPWSPLGILIMELLQLSVRRSNAPEDHSSKSVEPTSRERYGNTEPSPRNSGGRRREDGEHSLWMKVQSDSHRKVVTQRSAVQIRPRNHERHCRNAVAF